MGYAEFLVHSPWFWTALAALSLAAAGRCLLAALLPRARSRRRRGRLVAAALVLLSAALVLLTLAIFVPGPTEVLDPALWLFALLTAVVSLVALMFPLLLGVPLVLLLSAFMVLFSGYLQTWTAVHPPADLAALRVVAAHDGTLHVELLGSYPRDRDQLLAGPFEIEGAALSIEVELLELHRALFLLGQRYAIRLRAVHGYRFDAEQTDFTLLATHDLSRTSDDGASWSDSLLYAGRIPGVTVATLSTDARRVAVLSRHVVHMPEGDRLVLDARR